jgi:hypothetical protein
LSGVDGDQGVKQSGPVKESHASPAQVQPLQRPERRVTILLLATAVTLGFVGTTLGALMLAFLSGVPSDVGLYLFSAHPFLQVFGFVSEFVMGVGYSLLPRFKVGHFPRIAFAYAVYGMMTTANICFLLSQFAGGGIPFTPAGSLLMVASSMVFAVQVASVVLRRMGGFPEVDPLLILSPLSLVLTSVLLFLEIEGVVTLEGGYFSPQLLFLALVGFAGSEIYAVQIRSVSFRQCDYRRKFALSASVLQAAAVATTFADALIPDAGLQAVSGLLFLSAAVSVLLSIKVLELAHPLMLRPAMTKMHYTILRYNEACIVSAAVWLLIGCFLGLTWLGFGVGTFFVRDTFIHSVAIGFIGADITCFAPMLLPGLLGRKGPVTGLSYWPIALLDLGVVIRVAGNLETLLGASLPVWEASSGPVIIVAMVWFLFMLKNVGVKRQEAPARPAERGAEEFSLKSMENLIDVNLAIENAPSARNPVPIWFILKDGFLYALPSQGTETPWYREVMSSPKVSVSFRGRKLSGTALPVIDDKQVKRIIRKFKDKYGQRNYENYVGERANVGVKIEIEHPTG